MGQTIRNTQFNNLVNYETKLSSNSSRQSIVFQSSADPNSLSAISKNNQIIEYSLLVSQEKIIQETNEQKQTEE